MTLGLLGGLALAVAGCEHQAVPSNNLPNMTQEYNPAPQSQPAEEPVAMETFRGKIVKVQPSQLSFIRESGANSIGGTHEFIYLIAEGEDRTPHVFVYPSSRAILERNALLTYRPLRLGAIDSEEFIDAFVEREYRLETMDDITIRAEGIITPDGICYTGADK